MFYQNYKEITILCEHVLLKVCLLFPIYSFGINTDNINIETISLNHLPGINKSLYAAAAVLEIPF